jgi:hypothetical protein
MNREGLLNKLAEEIHVEARNNGWYSQERSPLEFHMLIVSELAEATEEVRNNKPSLYKPIQAFLTDSKVVYNSIVTPIDPAWELYADQKPEGEAVEIIDALIRILDYCAYSNIDIDNLIAIKRQFNQKRGYRHGNKRF